MVNFVDEVLNTASTQNKIKYKLTKENNSTEIVQIDLYTPVTTQGTPLNKVTFDSIKTDIEAKLPIANKATQAEVIAGTNNTKYITPQNLKGIITSREKVYTSSTPETDTIYTFGNDIGRITINGWLKGKSTTINGYVTANTGAVILRINYNNGSALRIAGALSGDTNDGGLKIEIDFTTKQIFVADGFDYYYTQSGSQYTMHSVDRRGSYDFNSIESITIEGKNRSSANKYVIALYREL